MNTKLKKLIFLVIAIIIGYLYYYITLPAINIHSEGFWWFLIVIFLLICAFIALSGVKDFSQTRPTIALSGSKKLLVKIFGGIGVALILIFIIGSLASSTFFNAGKYTELINISDSDFTKDIEQISFNEIPLLDKDSAEIIGNRKMGSMVEYVSQFEVSSDYTQINDGDKPVRVTPLEYGNLLKWFTNKSDGIPAYIKIDMTTQDAECVKLKEGMKYTESDHFGRNIYRYLRFRYPTYMFDTLNFEIDDQGQPVWICPVKDFTIGLFGGETISKVVIVNAVTGDHQCYDTDNVPTWVDRVYSADLLISYYNYYGSLKHGFWNSKLSQKDCLKTTDGYNYIALDNDVWVYTGITSVGQDQSNVGFILMNQRTGQTKYYPITGAEEYSAMSSAEGKVQHLNYNATFPLLLNINDQPTYFMSLKDSAGLVKQYAMVNVSKYTIVAIGQTVNECEEDYIKQLNSNALSSNTASSTTQTFSGTIERITTAVIDGNSHFYLQMKDSELVIDVPVADFVNIVTYKEGDSISLSYIDTESKIKTITKIN